MKTLVVGDLHGKLSVVSKVLSLGMPTIFVGDYLDSFTESVEDQVSTLLAVMMAVENGRAQALWGNHELSYVDSRMACSGYKGATAAHVLTLSEFMHKTLKPFIWDQGFLITHAGVSNRLLNHRKSTLQEYLDEGDFNQIGYSRGGRDRCGGLFWCDFREEFEPVPGVNQVFGHSRGNDAVRTAHLEDCENWCIDNLDGDTPSILAIEAGKGEIWEL